MTPSPSNDLAPLRRLALFSLAIAAVIIGAIALARIGLPTQWAPIGIAWAMLCATVLVPIAFLERVKLGATAWPRDLLAGPCTVAMLILLWLIGYLGVAGLVVVVLVAMLALAAALMQELPAATPPRLLAWLIAVFLLALPLIGALDGSKYANFIADRLMLFGRADGDTMFHAALINSLRYFGVTATGIDGIVPTTYHVGVHLLSARVAAMAGADAVPTLIAVRAVLVTPLSFFAIAAGGIVWARRRGATTDRPMLAAILAFVLTLGAGSVRIGAAGYDSESMILAAALIMLSFPAFLLAASGPGLGRLGWTATVLLVLPMAAAKISAGFVWAGLVGWWALRKLGLRRRAFWLVGIGDVLLFGIGLWLFRPSEAYTTWFGTPYYLELIRDGDFLGPILVNLIGFAVMAILWRAWRRPEPGLGTAPASDGLESLAIVFVLANLPGTVTEIYRSNAIYFVVLFGWVAVPLMAGEILRQAERRAGRKSAYAVAAVAILVCVVGLTLSGQRQWRLIVNKEALIRTGDLQYYDKLSQRMLRAGVTAATKQLGGIAGIFTTTPVDGALKPVFDAVQQFRTAAGNTGSVYVAPSTDGYWALTDDCDGKSLLPMSIAGVPMVDGYYADQTGCAQDFALDGYHGLPADLGKPLDDTGICAHAAAIRSTTVLVLSDIAPELKTRTLSCPAP